MSFPKTEIPVMFSPMSPITLTLLVAIIAFPILAGCIAARLQPPSAGRLTRGACLLSTLLAIVGAITVASTGTVVGDWLRFDALAAVMSILVGFLGTVILGFSKNYLAGDPHHSRFFACMSITLGSVLALVMSNHLLLLLFSWISMSLCLHRLLLHRPDRRGAVFSARKKFVFSRIGDVCLAVAFYLLHHNHSSWQISEIIASVTAGNTGGLPAAGYLIALCAVLKSAQFPFHSWLPDTMETPTPVSALMHAGIVNAGGFLILRFAPLYLHAPGALNMLVIFGAITAGFGAIVMLAQPGVKRSLAYSTVAQMGFMMLQCGLGAWPLALLHLVAHSLYKAHAFLTAGSTIGAVARTAIPLRTWTLVSGVLLGTLLVTGLNTLAQLFFPHAGSPLFIIILALALAYGLARSFSANGGKRLAIRALAMSVGIGLASIVLHSGASAVVTESFHPATPLPLVVFVGIIFIGLFIFQALLWRANAHPIGQRLYVHALNGFYVATIANKMLNSLWPDRNKA